jgi:Ca2+-transporting ATPase
METADPRALGLTAAAAAERLKRDGYNELPRPARHTPLKILAEVIREPMFALLLVGGVLYLVLGDIHEAILLLGFATVSVTITVVQEVRSEHTLEALRDLSSPRALVVRDGLSMRIPGREVVRGDIVVLAEGDRVPADGRLLTGEEVTIDESLLTGESVPVHKIGAPQPVESAPRGSDDRRLVFSGTMVVNGQGLAEVSATGAATEIGRIGRSLERIEPERTPLSLQTRKLVRIVAVVGFGVSGALAILYGLREGSWLEGLLGGITLSMSMLPEEFPLVLTVFTVMGSRRISRARVLTRRASAVETLGAVTVLCTDKTGTLTRNAMTVAELRAGTAAWRPDSTEPMSAEIRRLAEIGALASRERTPDPMDTALRSLPGTKPGITEGKWSEWRVVREYGLAPGLFAMSRVLEQQASGARIAAAKGAPEAIARLCRLDPDSTAALCRSADEMARAGERVLAVATATLGEAELPDAQSGFALQPVGLIGFADPVRAGASAAVDECRSAGIRVVMVTGDYPVTAKAIATQVGIDASEVVTGDALSELDDAALKERVRTASVFARIRPEQKLRIVQALKDLGHVVAMTGDGVNDAPALKAAHIGVAMGGRGTDVAREAASIVLLDDDFNSLVRTIRLGRRIYDNILKAFTYILAVHVPIAGLALLPLLVGWPLILGPIHIAFIEMVIDPVCSIVFEAESEEGGIMRRPPRDPRGTLLSGSLLRWALFQGIVSLVAVGGTAALGIWRGMPETEVRALAFVALVSINIGLILVNRSNSASILDAVRRRSPILWAIVAVAATLLAAGVSWAPAQQIFHFGALHPDDLAISLGAGFLLLIVLDLLKPMLRPAPRQSPSI